MSQQLVKKGTNGKHENVMPRSWIEAIKDKNTGQTLVEILQGFNMYFLPYNGNTSSTRCLVPTMLRKKGLWITYVKYDGNVYTEWYAANEIDDKSWGDSSNWRIGNNTLVGDITISANGNWVINGTETEFKAVGEKGNTPLIRVANNRLQVSYDLGDTYIDVTNNPVYTKFRWLATTGDTQANNVGRIQASTDEGKTWTNMSNDFTNNLHISRYIGVSESLPTSGIAEGTIYAKGPTYADGDTSHANPIYRLWVYAWKGNTLAWQDNGEFTSIVAGVVQETGDSETEVMSQKAVSEKLSELGSEYNFEFDTIEKHWYPFDLKKGKTYLFYNDSDDAIYLYAAVSDGGGEYEEIREYGLPSRIWYEYTHNAGNRSYIVVNPRKKGVLKAYTGITKIIKKNEVAAKNDFNKCQAGINSNQDRIKNDCLSEEIKATWCRYTDGALIGSGSYLSCFKVDVTNINKLYVRTYLPDTASAAIAFFSNNNLYLKDSSVQGTDTGLDGVTFTADIPEDAEYAIITSSYNVNTNKPNIYTYDIGAVVGKVQKKIEINEKSISGLLYADIALPKAKKGWIRHGTGEFVDSDATLCYILDATKITKIKAYLKSDVSTIDGISFYSSNVINKDFYLQSSIAWLWEKPLGAWYETDIPKEAKIVCITSNIRDGFQPIVQLLQIEMNNLQDEKIATLIEQNKELTGIAKIKGIGDIYHYGMLAVAMREEINTIPSQSIFDVRHAAKLGFKCIEANLHKTSDGKYVVTHGVDGGLGHDFSDLFGDDAFGVKIGEHTLDELKSNYVYYTDKEEYAIPITTLEDFCAEAKKCGLMVMLQYSDTESISIAEGILGKDNIFMYHAPREQYDGVILDYLYYDTKSEIIAHCESIGKPFIYSMDNPSKFDDETLKEICKELHLKGYYIASAYCGKELRNKLKGFGFDFFAIDGVAKELKENQTIIGEKVVTFNADGSVTWGKYN